MKKSRYAKWWYGIVLIMVKNYTAIKNGSTQKEISFTRSIEKAIESIKQLDDGQMRLAIIEMVYFNQTHTIDGAALCVGTCRRTAQKWLSEFVYLVGEYEGY